MIHYHKTNHNRFPGNKPTSRRPQGRSYNKDPKEGDLTHCKNWWGITLLIMVNKTIANIINKRLLDTVNPQIRNEHAGFRPSKSCIGHINSLRLITEQSAEFRSPLNVEFIDMIQHQIIWNSLRCKGVPEKLISLIKGLYNNAKCRILHEDSVSRPINVNGGVRQ